MPYMDLIKVAQDEAKAGELPSYGRFIPLDHRRI